MSTRSSIALLNPDNTITAIYCHSDGDPEGVGATLTAHYSFIENAKSILAEGDCSYLETTIAESRFYNSWRGENTSAQTFANKQEWFEWIDNGGMEYGYLFDNEWKLAYL
jgi:hypothetical protein